MRGPDLFVLASHGEPMGVVYMEAMSTEAATVGTAGGGGPEIITDNVNGLLVPPRGPAALAGAIERLLVNPEVRRQVGQAAREKALGDFDSRRGSAAVYRRLFGVMPKG